MKKPLYSYIPKRLKIAGKRVNIELMPRTWVDEEEMWGCFLADEGVIKLCPYNTPEHVLDTLLHEIGHACYSHWNMQDRDDEERIVHTMASAQQQLFTDNEHLLRCIQKYTKAIREG